MREKFPDYSFKRRFKFDVYGDTETVLELLPFTKPQQESHCVIDTEKVTEAKTKTDTKTIKITRRVFFFIEPPFFLLSL